MSDYLEILTILIYLLPNLIHPHVESSSNTLHSYYLKHSFKPLGRNYHITSSAFMWQRYNFI